MEIDGQQHAAADFPTPKVSAGKTEVVFTYAADDTTIEAVYELRPEWRFVTKLVRFKVRGQQRVKSLQVVDAKVGPAVDGQQRLRCGQYGLLLRFGDSAGLFACLQNPFNKIAFGDEQTLTLAYEPDMDWNAEWGPFESDRACLGTYGSSDTKFPASMLPEWQYVERPDEYGRRDAWIDVNEVLAMSDCVGAFTTFKPTKSVRLHVDWCENVYQMDVSKPADWEEYQRIIVRAAELGCDHLLYSAGDQSLAKTRDSRDAWGWEELLWLNMGQKIRSGDWVPGKDELPRVVQDRIDFANQHGIKLVAYAYPTLPFMQDADWTAWVGRLPGAPQPGGYRGADTSKRSFQDWFVGRLTAFDKQTNLGGYSFDHWWIAYDESGTSKYAQWFGCRRIMQELRKAVPDILIDGRQQYQGFGPWTWVAGSYPHPTGTDEQPGSFRAFPDLHFSRVSADRTRSRNFWYRVQNFCPVDLMPGFTTHQTQRSDQNRVMRRDAYRRADWDYLGWKYSVISSIGTAPVNHVINYLPARSIDEYNAFTEADKQWHRDWLDFTDRNFKTLKKLRPIIGQPMLGSVDGTAAIDGDRGFVFVFNPNYRRMNARFKLDASIGLETNGPLVLKQLYPDGGKGTQFGRRGGGYLQRGDEVALSMEGASAMVLELQPAPAEETLTVLNVPGHVALDNDGTVKLTDVRGEYGAVTKAAVVLPKDKTVSGLYVNGVKQNFTQTGRVLTAEIQFAGDAFGACQPLTTYDAAFRGDSVVASVRVPARIFDQLAARKAAWPIHYDEEELKATWTAPWRMLLFIQIADPKPEMVVHAKLAGQPVEVKQAWSGVYDYVGPQTFVGSYIDLTNRVEPDRDYQIEIALPAGLRPGQFQGLFVDNVESETTDQLAK